MFQSLSSSPGSSIAWLGVFAAAGATSYVILRWLTAGRDDGGGSESAPASIDDAYPVAMDTEDTWIAAAVANELAHSRRRGDQVDLEAEIDDTVADPVPV